MGGSWGEISIINLILFILMLLILIICLVLIICLRCWRSSGAIKTNKRAKAITLVTTCFVLTIINLIVCVIEEVAILVSFSKRITSNSEDDDEFDQFSKFYRRISSEDSVQKEIDINREYYISYITLTYMEFMSILSLCILSILKKRIIVKTDNDIQTIVRGMAIDPYGRQVVVVHPEQIIRMRYQNNYNMNFGRSNYPYPLQNIDDQQVNIIPNNNQINVQKANYISKDKSNSSSSRSFA